jgi:hypothetical protein
MKTVRHWKRAGVQCDHHANSIEGALTESLRCAGFSLAGVPLMKVLLEDRRYAEYIVAKNDTYMFRLIR